MMMLAAARRPARRRPPAWLWAVLAAAVLAVAAWVAAVVDPATGLLCAALVAGYGGVGVWVSTASTTERPPETPSAISHLCRRERHTLCGTGSVGCTCPCHRGGRR